MKEKKNINQKVTVKPETNGFIQKIPYLIIILFAGLLAIGMYYHELWRDELEIYGKITLRDRLIHNLGDYLSIFYNFLMIVFLWFKESQSVYQFYHYIIIVAAIFILNKYSPFNLFEKFFLTFSYFLFFEYGIISRYYGFLVLMVFIIMFLLSRKKINYYIVIIPLIILASHSVNSFIFALPIFLFIINNLFRDKTITKNIKISYFLVFLSFIVIGLLYLTFTFKQKSQFETLAQAPYFMNIRCIWNSFLPLPKFTNHANFWDTSYFYYPPVYPANYDINIFKTTQNYFLAILSILIFVIILIKFSKKPVVFWVFLSNYVVLLIFLQIAKNYYIRHQGLLFIIFVYSYWLFHIADDKIYIPILNKIKLNFFSKINIDFLFKPMVIIFLLVQFVSSSYAFYKDVKYKFTLSHDAAKYIKENKLYKDHQMVGYNDYATQTIAINLKEKMFFPQCNSYNYFWTQFDENHKTSLPITDVYNACSDFTEKQNKKVLLILNFPITGNNKQEISSNIYQYSSYFLIKSFKGDIIQTDEQFWLYEVSKLNLDTAMNMNFDNIESYNNLGVSYLVAKQYDNAINVYEKAIDFAPQDVQTLNNLVSACDNGANSSKDPQDKAKYYNIAFRNCEKVYKANPEIAMANLVLGFYYRVYRNDLKNAVFYLNNAVRINPSDITAYQNLGLAYYDSKQYDKTIEVFEKALKINSQDLTILTYLGLAYKNTGNVGKAEEYAGKAKEISKK